MSDSILLQLKVDAKLKKKADDLFFNLGLDTPTAIRMFLRRSIMHNGIPFDVIFEKNEKECPLCKNISFKETSFNEAKKIMESPDKFKTYSNFSEIIEDMVKSDEI